MITKFMGIKILNFGERDKMLNIITPFSRSENLDFYYNNLKDKNVRWNILFHDMNIKFKGYGWIYPFFVFNTPNSDKEPNYFKINRFIEFGDIIDDDYYCFMNDDDCFDKEFFEKINNYNDDVIFIAMKRGDYIPKGDGSNPHGTTTLIPFPGVKAGHIGLEQIVVKGKVLKNLKFDLYNMADGVIAEQLQKDYKVNYVTDLYALFNYLQPGRWEKKEEQKIEIKKESKIKKRFEIYKSQPRDISEHLNTLKQYGDMCNIIVELGVNEGISTSAWALSLVENNQPYRKVYCYDYIKQPIMDEFLKECGEEEINLKFILANDLEVEIPECDLLFVDTLHEGSQLREELKLHADKVKKWIIFHDTESFRWRGVRPGTEGLQPAIDDFLINNKEWFLKQHFTNCNGLTIIERR